MGMVAVPFDKFAVFDARLSRQVPQLDREGKRSQVVVDPIVKTAGDHFFGMVLEFMEDRYVAIAGQVCADLADFLVVPEIVGFHIVVGFGAEGAQNHPAVGVVGDCQVNVGMFHHEVDHGFDLWLGGGVGTCAALFAFGAPFEGEVAVEIQPFRRRGYLDLVAIEIFQLAFREHPVIFPAIFGRRSFFQQARVQRADFPISGGIFDAHLQQTTISIDIHFMQAIIFFGPGVETHTRADIARHFRHSQLERHPG